MKLYHGLLIGYLNGQGPLSKVMRADTDAGIFPNSWVSSDWFEPSTIHVLFFSFC
jgi:hypothetical protein